MKAFVIALAMLMVPVTALLGADVLPSAPDMSNAEVPTEEQARSRLYEHLLQAKGEGLSATQSGRVIAKFRIGFDVPGFARTGDRIWLIHLVAIDSGTVKRVAWVNAESGAVVFVMEARRASGEGKLELRCAMARTEFVVGEKLPPPKVTIRNNTDEDVDLIGPTITVITCILVQPDKTRTPMLIAMPTGRDPRQMPTRTLKAGAEIEFTPTGFWHYVDGSGFQPYVFQQEGAYKFKCEYEGLTSDTIAITVRGRACEPAEALTPP